MIAHGTFERIDGRLALRYVRRLHHPIERVWPSVSQPAGLGRWFPCRVEGDVGVGGRLRFVFPADSRADDAADSTEVAEPSEGEVLVFDPPRRLWFTWDAEELRIDLDSTADGGCILTFTHLIPDEFAEGAARTAAGWHVCLDVLDILLEGGPAVPPSNQPTDRWRELYEDYIAHGFPHGAPVPHA